MIGKTNRENSGGETSRNTSNAIGTREDALIIGTTEMIGSATITAAMEIIERVVIFINIAATEIVPTRNTAVTSITIIKAIAMNTRAIGNPGSNGTGSKKSIPISIGMVITTAKMPI